MRSAIVVCALVLGSAAAAFAAPQSAPTLPPPPAMATPTPQAPPPPKPATTPPAAPTAAPPPSPQAPASRPAESWQLVNVGVELTITERGGSNGGATKTVVMLISNESRGSARSSLRDGTMVLNVDARPRVQRDNRIGLSFTIQYSPEAGSAESTRAADLSESMDVYLTDGKKTLVSQSADPKGDRKVIIEVTATIVR